MGEQNWGLSVVKITEKVMTQQQNKQSCAFQWARTKKMGIVQPRVIMAQIMTGLPGLRQSMNPRAVATIVVDLARK